MTFLNPAVLIGLVAGIIPIALHFINLKKLKKKDFSALYFMKELKKNKIKKLKLQQWLLLILRLLIIIFLVLAFAKPAIKNETVIGEKAKRSAIFIVDDSPSMNLTTENISAFNKAKSLIAEGLSTFTNDDDLYLYGFSELNEASSKPLQKKDVERKIKSIRITDVTSSPIEAIAKAVDIIGDAKTLSKEVFVFSDFQKISFNQKRIKNILSKKNNIKIFLVPVKGKVLHDFSISDFQLKTKLISENAPIKFSVVEKNIGKNISENRISLFLNDKRVALNNVNINAGEAKKIEMTTELKNKGFVNAKVELSDDDLFFNNRAFLNFYVKGKKNVLLLSYNKSDIKYIALSLSAEKKLNNRIEEKLFNKLTNINFNRYDVIFAVNPPVNRIEELKQYVRNGGGLVLFPNSTGSIDNFKRIVGLLKSGVYYGISKVGSSLPILFDKVDVTNPLFEGLFKGKLKKEMNSPKIKKHLKIKSSVNGRTIISLEDKSAFLSQYKLGKGKIFLFNVSPTLAWSDFPIKPIFAPLMNRVIISVSSGKNKGKIIFAGSEYKIRNFQFVLPTLKILTPEKNEIFININDLKGKKAFSFRRTQIAGFYKIYAKKKLIDEFAVNVNPIESDFNFYTKKGLTELLQKIDKTADITIVTDSNKFLTELNSEKKGSELWRLFLILSLASVVAEMFVARTTKKEFENFEGN